MNSRETNDQHLFDSSQKVLLQATVYLTEYIQARKVWDKIFSEYWNKFKKESQSGMLWNNVCYFCFLFFFLAGKNWKESLPLGQHHWICSMKFYNQKKKICYHTSLYKVDIDNNGQRKEQQIFKLTRKKFKWKQSLL